MLFTVNEQKIGSNLLRNNHAFLIVSYLRQGTVNP